MSNTAKVYFGFAVLLASMVVAVVGITIIEDRRCMYRFRLIELDVDCTVERSDVDAPTVSRERLARLWMSVHARRAVVYEREATQRLAIQATAVAELKGQITVLGHENEELKEKLRNEEAYSRRLVQNLSDETMRRTALETQSKSYWEQLVHARLDGERLATCEAEVHALKSKGVGLGSNGSSALVN